MKLNIKLLRLVAKFCLTFFPPFMMGIDLVNGHLYNVAIMAVCWSPFLYAFWYKENK